MQKQKAVVLLSGGQDSTTVFYLARLQHNVVGAITFDYGQRHRVEIELAQATAKREAVPWMLMPVALSRLSLSTLTDAAMSNVEEASASNNAFAAARGLPPSFTPGRNLVFFSMGAAYAAKLDATVLVTGVCQQDRAGYPDCRVEFVGVMQHAVMVGFDWPEFEIDAPLLTKTKAETWELAASLGIVDEIVFNTNSCYEGDRTHFDKWGYGCGVCGACIERKKGYEEMLAARST